MVVWDAGAERRRGLPRSALLGDRQCHLWQTTLMLLTQLPSGCRGSIIGDRDDERKGRDQHRQRRVVMRVKRCSAGWSTGRVAIIAVGLLLVMTIGFPRAKSQEAKSPAELAERIDRLIKQLDDDKFEVREKAEQELLKIGEPAAEK